MVLDRVSKGQKSSWPEGPKEGPKGPQTSSYQYCKSKLGSPGNYSRFTKFTSFISLPVMLASAAHAIYATHTTDVRAHPPHYTSLL